VHLGPCTFQANSPHTHVKGSSISSTVKLVLVIGLLLCSLVFASATIIKARALKKSNASISWKLTTFQRLDFTCEDVLECLKEENIIGKGGVGVLYKDSMQSGEEFSVKRLPGIGRGSSHDHGFVTEIQTRVTSGVRLVMGMARRLVKEKGHPLIFEAPKTLLRTGNYFDIFVESSAMDLGVPGTENWG
jgi:hypothetical protein